MRIGASSQILSVFVCASLLTACVTPEQRRQKDAELAATFAQQSVPGENGKAIALFAVGFHGYCERVKVGIEREGDFEFQWISGYSNLRSNSPHGSITLEAPGTYRVKTVICDGMKIKSRFVGPFARFTLKSGEAVNLGILVLEYKNDSIWSGETGTLKLRVGQYPEEALAEIRGTFPETMSKITQYKPMSIIGPDVRRTERY